MSLCRCVRVPRALTFMLERKLWASRLRLLQVALQSCRPSTLHSQAPRGRFLTLSPIALHFELCSSNQWGKKSTEALICIPLILNEVKPHPGDLSLLIFFPLIFFTHFLLVFFIV